MKFLRRIFRQIGPFHWAGRTASKPEDQKTEQLNRSVVQVRANAVEQRLIGFGGVHTGVVGSLSKFFILFCQCLRIGQLGLQRYSLAFDDIARAPDDEKKQPHDCEGSRAYNGPGMVLNPVALNNKFFSFFIEFPNGNHLV